jgi:hypothetical protein
VQAFREKEMKSYTEDLLECYGCGNIFDREASYEYQIEHNHVLDDDVPDSDAVCSACGSNEVGDCDYTPITLGDKVRQVAINLAGGAIIAAVVWVALVGIFAIDALVGGAK